MEGVSVIVPCFNKLDITKELVYSLQSIPFDKVEFVFIDNGSTDGTVEYLRQLKANFRCCLNRENLGLVKAFNQGATFAKYETVVFMHNDVIIHDSSWPERIIGFFNEHPEAGVVGLYGAKRIRKDGSYMGRGIVHAKLNEANLQKEYVEVAVIDGLFMALKKDVFEKIGGFDPDYVMHYYDKDISLRALTAGFKNYVINIPFTHKGGSTRSLIKIQKDNELRARMKEVFLKRWHRELPVDVRTIGERFVDWLRKYV